MELFLYDVIMCSMNIYDVRKIVACMFIFLLNPFAAGSKLDLFTPVQHLYKQKL
jgi:hypothetical protein